MNELYEKLDKVKAELDNLDIFKELDDSIKRVKDNKELMDKIDLYNRTKSNDLRLEIYNYDEIKEYKKLENEVNLLILGINNRLKKINNKRSCHHESN